jgi:hypothetical protein
MVPLKSTFSDAPSPAAGRIFANSLTFASCHGGHEQWGDGTLRVTTRHSPRAASIGNVFAALGLG